LTSIACWEVGPTYKPTWFAGRNRLVYEPLRFRVRTLKIQVVRGIRGLLPRPGPSFQLFSRPSWAMRALRDDQARILASKVPWASQCSLIRSWTWGRCGSGPCLYSRRGFALRSLGWPELLPELLWLLSPGGPRVAEQFITRRLSSLIGSCFRGISMPGKGTFCLLLDGDAKTVSNRAHLNP
jgi:hypothetical protein